MDPKLDQLVNCTGALEYQGRLTPELSGRALSALCIQPKSHLVGAFQDCVLLYNDCFINTWTVDEEHLRQLERIIRPWFTYWSQSHGYRLLPETTVKEIRSKYSLGTSVHLPMYMSVLLELEYMKFKPGDAIENYFKLFKAMRSALGQTLFNTVYKERFSELLHRMSLCGNGAAGYGEAQTQSKECAHPHSTSKDPVLDMTSSIPPSLDERYPANAPPQLSSLDECCPANAPPQPSSRDQHNTATNPTSKSFASTDPRPNDVPNLDLILRSEALSSSVSEEEPMRSSPSIDCQDSVTEDQPPSILVHSTPEEDNKQKQASEKKDSNAARHSAQAAPAVLYEDSGMFEESLSQFEHEFDPNIFDDSACPDIEETNRGKSEDSDNMVRLEKLEATIHTLSLEITQRDEIIEEMKAREDILMEALAKALKLKGNVPKSDLDLLEARQLPEHSNTEPSNQTDPPSETSILERAGASCDENCGVEKDKEIPTHNKSPKPTPRLSLL